MKVVLALRLYAIQVTIGQFESLVDTPLKIFAGYRTYTECYWPLIRLHLVQ